MKSATISRIKEQLKSLAKNIRQNKHDYKEMQRGNLHWSAFYEKYKGVNCSAYDYRTMHIAYCLLRGKKYEQIEQKVRPGNEPNMKQVEAYLSIWRDEVAREEEALRAGA